VLFCVFFMSRVGMASEELITPAPTKSGEAVPYVLDALSKSPKYALILFPGGNGVVDPHREGDKLVYGKAGNFLLRARQFLVDDDFATATTNSTPQEDRIQAVIDDLNTRFPGVKIYLIGTSRGTFDTIALAGYLSDKIAGEIHTSSVSRIASFDGKSYKNRQLVVHHKNDGCRVTPYGAAEDSHTKYGTDFIAMEGGISVGNPCEAFAYHGYNGIERETAEAIKRWVRQGE
jgi:hypothetical protein